MIKYSRVALNHKWGLFIILFSIVVSNSFAQLAGADVKDFQTWTAIEVSYALNKKIKFSLEQQLRLKDNSTITDQYFTELNAEYEAFKNVEFGFGARYISNHDTKGEKQGFDNFFRFNLDAAYKYKLKRFSLKHRLRYQNRNELGTDDNPVIGVRFKTSLGYNIKKWKLDPKITGEIFNRFEKGEDSRFSKYRLGVETEYKINKMGVIALFYRLEKETNIINAETINILGLKFSYRFKK